MKKILPLFFLLIIVNQLFSNEPKEIKIERYRERIVVHGADKGFTRYISIEGKSYINGYFIPATIDQENDSLYAFSLFYKKSKYKKVKNASLIDSPDFNNFHNSRIIKVLEVDSGKNFLCNYTVSCKDLILLSSIDLSPIYETDTAIYQLSAPSNLSIKFDTLHFSKLAFHLITQDENKDSLFLTVKAKPATYDSVRTYNAIPMMRLIIVPDSLKGKESLYFNNWFTSRIEKVSSLNEESKKIIDSIAASAPKVSDPITCYYDFIHSRFKYLDIQVGLGAFIPRNVNSILKNRQGDCKDLSTLLYSILSYKGYDAHLALASTNSHPCDFDFPSLHSGDHMICTVKKDSLVLLLDPTDINHSIGEPVMSLQGKTIFIMDKESPVYVKVPIRSADENRFHIRLNMKAKSNNLEGGFTIVTTGFMSDAFKQISSTQGNRDLQKAITYSANDIFQKQTISSISKTIKKDSIIISGTISYANKYYSDNNLIYLFTDFIPVIYDSYIHNRKLSDENFLASTMDKLVELNITFDKEIKKIDFTPLTITTSNHQLDYTVTQKDSTTISIAYHFVSNAIWLKKEEIEPINKLIDNFNSKTNETIVLHY